MKTSTWLFALLLLPAAPGFCDSASVHVSAKSNLPPDSRPFGKYFVEICTISGEQRTLRCSPNPADTAAPRDADQLDQTITIKLACDPSAAGPCSPQYPVVAGSDFFVAATADSGQTVRQEVRLGSATPVGGNNTIEYRANGPGVIVIRATAGQPGMGGSSRFRAAAPVDLILQVVATAKQASSSCNVLPAGLPATSTPLDAPTIVSLLGNPTPFILAAQGPNAIAIYSTRQPIHPNEQAILNSFQDSIAALAGRTSASLGITPAPAKPFSVELKIPHAAALGDLAMRVNGLNYGQFTVQDVGGYQIRVTAPTQPDCDSWKGFLSDIRHMDWQLISEPMSKKLFYLSSSDVASAFTSLVPSATAPTTPVAPQAPTVPPPPTAVGPSNATITVIQPPGSNIELSSDTTPCVVTGLASGNSTPCGGATTTNSSAAPAAPPAAPAAAPAPKAPLAMASVAVAAGNGEQTPPDLLVYSDTNPGDDAQIQERNRIIAQLDLPRPEMIISAWVTQNSTANARTMGAFTNMVKVLVADYDHEFENVVLRGWASVKAESATPGYFNESFRSYIEDRFVADTIHSNDAGSTAQQLSQSFLDGSQAELHDPLAPVKRTNLGVCERGRYCLGYDDLFDPVKPALTDLLLTIIAAQNPVEVALHAVNAIEDGNLSVAIDEDIAAPSLTAKSCDEGIPNADARNRCRAVWNRLDLDAISPPPQRPSCSERDYRGIFFSLFFNDSEHEARVHLRCFEEAAIRLLAPAAGDEPPPYGVGLLRAAVADFLFNYKMSQQYPHEFSDYDLQHSADALNTALSPLIDAFNRDLWSYQLFVRADMQYRVEQLNARTDGRCCVKRLFGLDKPSFFNDGLVTVRTISGQGSYVNTVSQSSLNVSTAPQLTSLLSSLTTSGSGTPGANSLAGAALSANPAARAAALAGVLSNYQTTFAQIGRTLAFSAIPRSLNTASSAEIAVTLNADESAAPSYYGTGTNTPTIDTSRIASHDTATRVRVDSIKLFEVSSFSAIVERSRSRFPLLPPFVEIPYIGTFAGIPLGSAKEFHSSTAILSAYVVPTAADIAYGLRFVPDLVVDGLNPGPCSLYPGAAGPDVPQACLFRKALSVRDFNRQPIQGFNRRIIRCFATNTSNGGCQNMTFDSVPRMY